ncbi:MAG: HAD family phosphatase [Flavobacteriales bacterium]|jgi:Cof subfamily protein (haloacid dehalogenase superfamily)|nr:HAD family phosphatase [Flavobacteriales bacterium]MBQ5815138.1 HAD family phosphatase [Flavobacteriales bacterium]
MSKNTDTAQSIKLVCSDIDGTLLDSTRDVSAATAAAIEALDKKGIPFVMISARMPRAMRPFQYKSHINRPIVCFNGAYIESEIKEDGLVRVLRNRPINYECFIDMLIFLSNYDIHVSTFHKDSWYANRMDRWTEREINNTRCQPEIIPNNGMIHRFSCDGLSAHKVLLMGEVEIIEEVYHKLSSMYGEHVDIYRSKDTYLEINAKAVSKDKSLDLLARYYNIKVNDIMAFGDNYNDIGMLTRAGMGVAVGNAKDVVKTAANATTLRNTEDGVATYINEFFKI